MIPHFEQPTLSLGPVSIHAFGVLVAVGILIGMRLIRRRATFWGLDPATAERLTIWILLGGFAGAHLIDRLVYFPADALANPWSLLRFWEGLSSFGGFLGAIVGAALFVRREHLGLQKWPYLDLVAYAFPTAWFFGRTGCFLAFDHPGSATGFFLAQTYSDGVIRHNLGLDEALYTLPVALLFLWLGRRRARAPGFFVGLLAVVYAPVRFLLDFLRYVDVRYFDFTPGQYGAAALLVVGVLILWRVPARREAQPPVGP
ncbi:MAG TPA: prolipoprotein diacylglyceryl transferase family protein [Polyangia bacterium]|jgi:Prolipoprotein diacylglyceryltransferase|nr:prolipoprotein diacylglyceryl transferase family protein [Polyangia bacterium]